MAPQKLIPKAFSAEAKLIKAVVTGATVAGAVVVDTTVVVGRTMVVGGHSGRRGA